MILGTSKVSVNLGPINGHFWACGPRIYGFSDTEIPQKIFEKYYFHFLELQKFVKFGPTKHLFVLIFVGGIPPKKYWYILSFLKDIFHNTFWKILRDHLF